MRLRKTLEWSQGDLKLPAIQFYTGDWKKDPNLSMCQPATRGVWIDLLCAMHDAGQTGLLRGTPDQLAAIARCQPADVTHALTDLQTTEAADVTERNGVFTVINRRMHDVYLARVNARERKRKERCHKNVTTPSSSSSSATAYPQPPEGGEEGEMSREERKRQRNRKKIMETR